MVLTYEKCAEMARTRKRKLDHNTYLILDTLVDEGRPDAPLYHVKLHATNIITFYPDGGVELNTGGWRTPTTKDRMNKFSGAHISQERGLWTVRWDGKDYDYADTMRMYRDGPVLNAGNNANAVVMRRRVRQYVLDYMQAFHAGEVPPPGPGDCFMCQSDMGGSDHLVSHMRESYYVPSLLRAAIAAKGVTVTVGGCVPQGGPISVALAHYITMRWSRTPMAQGWMAGIARRQAHALLFGYMAKQLGLVSRCPSWGKLG